MNKLRHRLNTLRKQTASNTTPITSASELPSVEERIKRAQLKQKQMQAERLDEQQLADLLQAELHRPGLIIKETVLPLESEHGSVLLRNIRDYESCDISFTENYNADNLVFLDTETTGLAGGAGTLVFLLGLAKIEGEELILCQYLLSGFSGEKAMLKHAKDWINRNSIFVTFNGKSFDLPLLNSRYRLMRIMSPFHEQKHIDLMHPMRRAFSNRWPDCRLQTAERRLINFHRVDDLPGSEAPVAWFDWVRSRQHKRLLGIVEHNYWDVLSMVAMLPALAKEYIQPDPGFSDVCSIARGLLSSGHMQKAYELLLGNERHLTHQGLLSLARLHRSYNQWRQAVAIWQKLAEWNCLESIEHLAKYYEHQAKDLKQAQANVERLILLDQRNLVHFHRKERLHRKLCKVKVAAS